MASEASQKHFAVLTTNCQKISEIRTLGMSESGGGGKPTGAPPTLLKVRCMCPRCPFSYALEKDFTIKAT